MINLRKTSNKKLTQLLHDTDDMNVLEEMARRIKLGLIPLAMVDFPKLSNMKLRRLDTLSDCDWTLREIAKRMKDGRIPTRVTTIEEVLRVTQE